MVILPEGTRGGSVPKNMTPRVGVRLGVRGAGVKLAVGVAAGIRVFTLVEVGAVVLVGEATTGVLLGIGLAVGWDCSACAEVAASRAAEVAAAFTVGVGLSACCRKAGMHAFRASERISASRSDLFMPNSLWCEAVLVLCDDFHKLADDISKNSLRQGAHLAVDDLAVGNE